MASRIGKRGQTESEYVVEITQSRDGYFDSKIQALADAGNVAEARQAWQKAYGNKPYRRDFRYRCGSTLLIDAKNFDIRRVVRTDFRVDQDQGLDRMRRYLRDNARHAPNAFDDPAGGPPASDTFAALHRHVERCRF